MDVDPPNISSHLEGCNNVPFKERWELLKPEIERLWLDEKVKLQVLVQTMKEQHSFDASETQYKYRFKQWGFKRSMSAQKKQKIIEIGQTRAALGKSTAVIHKGRQIESRQIRRQAKRLARNVIQFSAGGRDDGSGLHALTGITSPFGNRIFLNWNLPYAAMAAILGGTIDHPSPFGGSASTPSDVVMNTPPAVAGSPRDAPSPLSAVLRKGVAIQRANLFIEGRHLELIKSLDVAERKIASTWLHQFWLFAFTTAKYWGRGPRRWTATNLGFLDLNASSAAASPNYASRSPLSPGSNERAYHRENAGFITDGNERVPEPTQLCRWSIHVFQEEYEGIESPPTYDDDHSERGINQEWPESWNDPTFEHRLTDNLASNDFSSVDTNKLPLAVSQVSSAASRSPDQLLEESIGFAIVGGNAVLLSTLLEKANGRNLDLSSLHPYHLAATYLDGSKTCCQILELFLGHFESDSKNAARHLYVNDVGHTVLDQLFINILRSHSSILPRTLGAAHRHDSRFAGEEVDICGRWGPDSECYRRLISAGHPKIPSDWKHKFCHTSVQAICHCISILRWGAPRLDIRTTSGLFQRLCPGCGLRLQLQPLHALVVIAYYLTTYGFDGEDLFGIISCLLQLLTIGFDPTLKAKVSLAALLDMDEGTSCTHEDLSAAELARQLEPHLQSNRSDSLRIGWETLSLILQVAESISLDAPELDHEFHNDQYAKRCMDCYEYNGASDFGLSNALGHIWAMAQTEILNYRRLEVADPWVSENFDIKSTLRSLMANEKPSSPFIDNSMMKAYCPCGNFGEFFPCARREDVATYYFSNLDDWERSSFINDTEMPRDRI